MMMKNGAFWRQYSLAKKKETTSRDKIRREMEKYMESGEFSGNLGDIILIIAASFLWQPALVIEVNNCKVTNSHWVAPNKLFGGENHSLRCPVVVLSQLNHYELVLVAEEAKGTIQMKYQQWETSERVCLSPGRENLNPSNDEVGSQMGNLAERSMLEPDGTFSPPLTSTPMQQQCNEKFNEPSSKMDCEDFNNEVRYLSITFNNFVCRRM